MFVDLRGQFFLFLPDLIEPSLNNIYRLIHKSIKKLFRGRTFIIKWTKYTERNTSRLRNSEKTKML